MSLAKVEQVKAARKPQGECESCGTEIKVGDPYLHFTVGFRSTFKRVRCTAGPCHPRPSERESSKLAAVYAAQENAHDTIRLLTVEGQDYDAFIESIKEVMSGLADETREVVEEYRDAAVDPNGNTFNSVAEERADTLEGAADEVENWDPDSDEPQDGESDEEWVDAVKDEAYQAIDGMEMP